MMDDLDKSINDIKKEHERRVGMLNETLKTFLFLGILPYLIVVSIGYVGYYFTQVPWLLKAINYFSSMSNLISIWFITQIWLQMYKNSKFDEVKQDEQKKKFERVERELLKLGYPNDGSLGILDIPWINHKRNRLRMGIYYLLLALLNVFIIWITLFK